MSMFVYSFRCVPLSFYQKIFFKNEQEEKSNEYAIQIDISPPITYNESEYLSEVLYEKTCILCISNFAFAVYTCRLHKQYVGHG